MSDLELGRSKYGLSIAAWGAVLYPLGFIVIAVLAAFEPNRLSAVLSFLNAAVLWTGTLRATMDRLRPVAAALFIFSFAWLGVAPIIQISTNSVAWNDWYILTQTANVNEALAITLAASVCILIGAELARTRGARKLALLPGARPSTARLWYLMLGAIGFVLITPNAVGQNGGIAALFQTRRGLAEIRDLLGSSYDQTGGAQYALIHYLPGSLSVVVTLLSIHLLQRRSNLKRAVRYVVQACLVVGIAGLILFCNPLANSRFTALAAFGSVLLLLFKPRSVLAGRIFLVSGLMTVFVFYPLGNAFRDTDGVILTGQSAYTGPDFDGFQQIANTVRLVDYDGHTWGSHLIAGVLFFVPRSLWTTKPDSAAADVATNAGYVFTNLSLPLHAELFLEFGVVGMCASLLILGWIVAVLDNSWLYRPDGVGALLAAYVSVAMVGIVRGPIAGQIPTWGATVILLALGMRHTSIVQSSLPDGAFSSHGTAATFDSPRPR